MIVRTPERSSDADLKNNKNSVFSYRRAPERIEIYIGLLLRSPLFLHRLGTQGGLYLLVPD
jgi:hypothetical protein